MSRKLLAFLLGELKTVRVLCRNQTCGMAYEMSLDQFVRHKDDFLRCKFCNHDFHPTNAGPPPLLALAEALKGAQGLPSAFDVEFVLPEGEPAAGQTKPGLTPWFPSWG